MSIKTWWWDLYNDHTEEQNIYEVLLPFRRNEKNACYCVDGFSCMKSGVLNMGPCKRTPSLPTGAPMALSYPHFYQADKHYLDVSRQYYPIHLLTLFNSGMAIRPKNRRIRIPDSIAYFLHCGFGFWIRIPILIT